MKGINENQKIDISSHAVTGSRDRFSINKIKVSSSGYAGQVLFKVDNITCSGYKVNDYDFNMSFEKYFKIPTLEDLEAYIKTPLNCTIEGLEISLLDDLYNSSKELLQYKYLLDLFKTINIQTSTSFTDNIYKQDVNLNFSERIYLNTNNTFDIKIDEIHLFVKTFIENVVYKYWGYKNYKDLYADTSNDTSEIYLDFVSDASSNPLSYFNYLPSYFPKILLKKFNASIMWDQKEYDSLKNNFPEIKNLMKFFKGLVSPRLSQKQFNILIDTYIDENIDSKFLYGTYLSTMDALQDFAESPRGLELLILSDEGINLVPNQDFLEEILASMNNRDISLDTFYGVMMLNALGSTLSSIEIDIKANPQIEN
tara:strand:- start:25 stop:1128 length:1104 start_codon:yes stop_codon:yes gene_type:complete